MNNRSSVTKGIGLAVLLIIVSLIPNAISYYFPSNPESSLEPPIIWNTESALGLSEDMETHFGDLLSISVSANWITQIDDVGFGWTWISANIFNINASGMSAYYSTESEEWIYRTFGIPDEYDPIYRIDPTLLSELPQSISKEFSKITNLTSYSHDSAINDVLKIGSLMVSISHLYNDGSYIEIQIIENNVFIHFAGILTYVSSYRHQSWSWDPNYQEIDYIGTYDGELEYYIDAVNQIISEVEG